MAFQFNIQRKLLALSLLGVAFVFIVGAAGYVTADRLSSANQRIADVGAALKAQTDADMAHDALRGDVLATLLAGGYHAFAEAELAQREVAGFPPFAHMAMFRAEAQQVETCDTFLRMVRETLRDVGAPIDLHGPLPAPMPRRAGYQRMQLLLSAADRRSLHAALDAALPVIHASAQARKVRWSLDVDPVDLY